ncbi:MAG TPA: hypothetical protein ENN20_03985 [Candidatus Marinimicrobia bacterium]|nr:hypothetical protein [Candidatus Neomarinimicrobiota bacterium]
MQPTATQIDEIFNSLLDTELPRQTAIDENSTDGPDFCRLITKRYRACSLDAQSRLKFHRNFQKCVDSERAVQLNIPIGGYKKCHLTAAPEADWAEFFNLAFMKDLALKIAACYEPGVQITYLASGFIRYGLNITNYPPDHFYTYFQSMEKLTAYLNEMLSGTNIKFSFETVSERIDHADFMAHFRVNLQTAKTFWKDPKNTEQITNIEKKARKNYYCPQYTPTQKEIRESAQTAWAYLKTFAMLKCIDADEEIPVILRKGMPGYLHLRSSYNSVVQFWVGEGVLVRRKNTLFPTILSDKNLKKCTLAQSYPTDRFKELGNNFHTIKVVREIPD